MNTEVWLGILLGAGTGGLYGLAIYAVIAFSERFQDNRFLVIVFGGMLLRMVLLLLVVSAILLFVPVHLISFVASLITVVLFSLGLEVWILARRVRRPRNDKPTTSP